MHTRNITVGAADDLDRDRPARQAGRRRRRRPLGRHDGARHRAAPRRTPREGIDFLPLTVDYREYTYASGRIPGGFFKREGKPSEKEVLTSRLIDRPIRPLFPDGWRRETQIIALRALRRHRERLGRAGDHRRLGGAGALGHPVHRRRSPACASAWSTASTSSTRPSSSAAAVAARPDRRRAPRTRS